MSFLWYTDYLSCIFLFEVKQAAQVYLQSRFLSQVQSNALQMHEDERKVKQK